MANRFSHFRRAVRKILLLPLIFYQKVVGAHLPKICIYQPSCSEYAKRSILRFGIFRGVLLGAARIFRCFGFLFTGGNDPVPQRFSLSVMLSGYKKYRKRKS